MYTCTVGFREIFEYIHIFIYVFTLIYLYIRRDQSLKQKKSARYHTYHIQYVQSWLLRNCTRLHTCSACSTWPRLRPTARAFSFAATLVALGWRVRTHCNSQQHTAMHCSTLRTLQHTVTHCNTLQHTATHCNTLQHTETHYNTLHHTASHCNTLQHTMKRRGWLQVDWLEFLKSRTTTMYAV